MSATAHSHDDPHVHDHGHEDGGHHGNPADLEGYLSRLEGPERVAWQKPDEVIERLALPPGAVVGEIGAGPGFFSIRLGRAVGREGVVYAVDVEPRILSVLRDRLEAAGAHNVVPILGLPDDPLLPHACCDLVLVVNTLHHFPDPVAYLERLKRSLRRGGRIVNIDFHKRENPVGPPLEACVDREDFLAMARRAGLEAVTVHDLLPHQYFYELRPAAGG